MLFDRSRRKGAHIVGALLVAGLLTSTAGRADTPAAVQDSEIQVSEIRESEVPEAVVPEDDGKHVGDGEASYYGNELAGNKTASGERFNPAALTAAHRTLPMGSKIRVTNKSNGKSVVVRINDRGPFIKHRLIDVSLAAAKRIDMIRAGKAKVRLDLLS